MSSMTKINFSEVFYYCLSQPSSVACWRFSNRMVLWILRSWQCTWCSTGSAEFNIEITTDNPFSFSARVSCVGSSSSGSPMNGSFSWPVTRFAIYSSFRNICSTPLSSIGFNSDAIDIGSRRGNLCRASVSSFSTCSSSKNARRLSSTASNSPVWRKQFSIVCCDISFHDARHHLIAVSWSTV